MPLALCPTLEVWVALVPAPPIMPVVAAQAAAAASVVANDVADWELDVVRVGKEPSPTAPNPTAPSALVPTPAMPRLDASGEDTIAVVPDGNEALCGAAEEGLAARAGVIPEGVMICDAPVAALHKAEALLPTAVGLCMALGPRLSPPPSNVGSGELPALPGHCWEFADAATPPVGPDCIPSVLPTLGFKGDVPTMAGIVGAFVCATPGLSPAAMRVRNTAEVMITFIRPFPFGEW